MQRLALLVLRSRQQDNTSVSDGESNRDFRGSSNLESEANRSHSGEENEQLERCENILREFLQKKPGLTKAKSFFPDYNIGTDTIKKAANMIAKLIVQGCRPGMAEEFTLLVLYDLVILVGE